MSSTKVLTTLLSVRSVGTHTLLQWEIGVEAYLKHYELAPKFFLCWRLLRNGTTGCAHRAPDTSHVRLNQDGAGCVWHFSCSSHGKSSSRTPPSHGADLGCSATPQGLPCISSHRCSGSDSLPGGLGIGGARGLVSALNHCCWVIIQVHPLPTSPHNPLSISSPPPCLKSIPHTPLHLSEVNIDFGAEREAQVAFQHAGAVKA